MKKSLIVLIFLVSGLTVFSQKVIFLHHSVGDGVYKVGNVAQWILNYNTSHGTAYQITERPYPNTPYPWANYPYDYWNLWINSQCDNTDPDIECMSKLTQDYDVIIFKHCFPGAHIVADNGNPLVNSNIQTLANYKLQYRALRNLMDSYPARKFIVWTLTPLHRLDTNTGEASRAKEFVDWVKTTWLTEDSKLHPNIFIFDFFGYVAESNPSPSNGQVNCLKYEYELSHTNSDSHPNTLANQTVGPIFAQFIVNTILNQSTGTEPLSSDSPVRIFPNPAVDEITVDLSGINNKIISIDIFDIQGNAVHHEEITDRNYIKISVAGFCNGLYIVNTKLESSVLRNKLIILK